MRNRHQGALRRAGLALAVAAGFGFGGAAAQALTLMPGKALELQFSFSSVPVVPLAPPNDVPDVLTVNLVGTNSAPGVTGWTVELLDGASSLGLQTTGLQTLWGFAHPTSVWTLNAVSADLTTVRDGSISGIVRFTPTWSTSNPTASFDVSFAGITVGFANAGNSLVPSSPAATVQALLVPEPALGALLLAGLFAGVRSALRRSRAA